MPGSPESSTTWPSPALASCQRSRSSANSCSRPTSGVSAAAAERLEAALGRPVADHPERGDRAGKALELVRPEVGELE